LDVFAGSQRHVRTTGYMLGTMPPVSRSAQFKRPWSSVTQVPDTGPFAGAAGAQALWQDSSLRTGGDPALGRARGMATQSDTSHARPTAAAHGLMRSRTEPIALHSSPGVLELRSSLSPYAATQQPAASPSMMAVRSALGLQVPPDALASLLMQRAGGVQGEMHGRRGSMRAEARPAPEAILSPSPQTSQLMTRLASLQQDAVSIDLTLALTLLIDILNPSQAAAYLTETLPYWADKGRLAAMAALQLSRRALAQRSFD
jgi:hypothetical protein